MALSTPRISTFQLPDIHCPFTLTYHESGDTVAAASDEWFAKGFSNLSESGRRRLVGMKAGQLSAYCYNHTNEDRLKVVSDWMNFLFHLDDLSDTMKTKDTVILADIVMNAFDSPHSYRRVLPDGRELPDKEPDVSRLARDYWGRCVLDAGPGFQARYCESMALFFRSVESEARSRDTGSILDLESFVVHRRDNSACKPCFNLLEYTLGIDLPDVVIKDDTFQAISQCANDFIGLVNDIFSYNVEQSRGDTYNSITVVMKAFDLELQDAVDYVADMCNETLECYCEYKAKLPSWTPQVNMEVAQYVQGLDDWISGTFHWAFVTERYFGTKKDEVRKTGVVELLPFSPRTAGANIA